MKKIELTQGKVALIDEEDWDLVKDFKWRSYKDKYTFYAITRIKHKPPYTQISLHRMIMHVSKNDLVDHINGDGLDNRKENLRVVNRQQNNSHRLNMMKNNTSGFRGVSLKKGRTKWTALIRFNGKLQHIGQFDTPEEAARAYDKKARELFGEYCGKLNFPE